MPPLIDGHDDNSSSDESFVPPIFDDCNDDSIHEKCFYSYSHFAHECEDLKIKLMKATLKNNLYEHNVISECAPEEID